MKTQIYHYKSQGGWQPFPLDEENGRLWNNFCARLALSRPDDPNPYYEDYIEFIENLKEVKSRSDSEGK